MNCKTFNTVSKIRRKTFRRNLMHCTRLKMLQSVVIFLLSALFCVAHQAMPEIVSKMTSHFTGTVQMREESERGIRKWEEMWFKAKAEA